MSTTAIAVPRTRREAQAWLEQNASRYPAHYSADGAGARNKSKIAATVCRQVGLTPASAEGKLIKELIAQGATFKQEIRAGTLVDVVIQKLQGRYDLRVLHHAETDALVLLPDELATPWAALSVEYQIYYIAQYPYRMHAGRLMAECVRLEAAASDA